MLMYEGTHDSVTILRRLDQTIRALQQDSAKVRRSGMTTMRLRNISGWQRTRDEVVETLQEALEWARNQAPQGEPWFIPRNAILSIFQSAMDEYLGKRYAKAKRQGARGTALVSILDQFDPSDPGWISVLWERLKASIEGKAKFIIHKSVRDFRFPLEPSAKIALVSDWGTGTPAAQEVAKRIRDLAPNHVIHLGDVYYAGTKKEIKERFRDYWPYGSSHSWALNSNHEMYSGGHGYFEETLKNFKQPGSYFNLRNQDWQIIGLDTGYVDHNLNKEQVHWLSAQLNDSSAKTILLCHHQLFSSYEVQGERIEQWPEIKAALEAGKITAWFWGHEHKCVVYESHRNTKGRCIGHGGLPYAVVILLTLK
jgi:predicted phosphodiesterase